MIDGLAPLNTGIASDLAVYDRAKELLESAIVETQMKCPHLQILHADGQENMFGHMMPLRMCACCRLEEESASVYSTPQSWTGPRLFRGVLCNSTARLVIPVQREEIYRLRLPGPRYLVSKDYNPNDDD